MLTLPIKKQWYDMILAKTKKEEYRNLTRYYDARFRKYENQKTTVRFRNGYRADSPIMECEIIPCFGRTGRPEWGAESGKLYWVLEILSVKELPII